MTGTAETDWQKSRRRATGGLYDPRYEHDSCGIGFIADINNRKSHRIIEDGLRILCNLSHRGAVGADPLAGDGSGILLQTPDKFLRRETAALGITLPTEGSYGVGAFFLPHDSDLRTRIERLSEEVAKEEGLTPLGWRDVPVDNAALGESVRLAEPVHRHFFVAGGADTDALERRLFILRRRIEIAVAGWEQEEAARHFYIPSLSARTLVYKGMLLADQVGGYYRDLTDRDLVSALALVHQRFSTNTFPSWRLAHPFRMICHNGEINTLRGNVNWMRARHAALESDILGDDLEKIHPLIPEGQSDTACFDNALELLVQGGYSLAHAMMLLIPEAWAENPEMDEQRRAFYEHHAALMEPWDGPAAIAFTDGLRIGATLDRNGLRPARWFASDDGLVVMASEAGVLPRDEGTITRKWRLQPGRMLLIDLEESRIVDDADIKAQLASAHPYREWLEHTQVFLENIPDAAAAAAAPDEASDALPPVAAQRAHDYSREDIKFLLAPMAEKGEEPIGSMGYDTPLPVLSHKPRLLYGYFKQNFAQVTNPPIDPIREALVMSLVSFIGPRPNLLELNKEPTHKRLEVRQPILSNGDLRKILAIDDATAGHFRPLVVDITCEHAGGPGAMESALHDVCARAEKAVRDGWNILVLSDRRMGPDRVAIPALLATAAVHHHLVREGLRTLAGLVVETAEAREIHHICCLAGYGAEAINPWLAFATIAETGIQDGEAHYIKALNKGLLKVMSKMGISTYQSYCGAQIFDAVGLSSDFVSRYFTGTATRVEGVGLEEIAEETFARHDRAFSGVNVLDAGGKYAFRISGESHVWHPTAVRDLQHAVRGEDGGSWQSFAAGINDQNRRLMTLRGLFRLRDASEAGRKPVALEEVESAAEIVKRFSTGAMSFGSISREAHTTLAIAMNRMGGKSNTGEGGEESDRFKPLADGDSMRSAIKQVASGRFGVTAEYLVNADALQIKIAQGAKPGEGGQLPAHKVDEVIAQVRHSTPGVGLISPPPHHDIYSIEDLRQLVFDLKNVNPQADISVKLVSEVGVGTVAAGVCKARADHVTISGFEGGTGASPLTSIRHAGSPWEIGLAETHQTLVLNELRSRISVQVDGGLRTGRDVVIGALLGADEFGFSTAPLIASGCLMMRKCHLNTCPVGIATQDPVLRKKFSGKPEHVVNYFFFVAEEVRELMASMGFRRFSDMIGRSGMLDQSDAVDHWKARGLDFSRVFAMPDVPESVGLCRSESQDHGIADVMDRGLIEDTRHILKDGGHVRLERKILNSDRSTGAMLSGEIARRFGAAGLADGAIHVCLKGSAGQSFGAFLARGVTLELEGEANDYTGKGLSGGRVIVYPPATAAIVPEESIIVGNTVLYGATSGECYFRGVAGERFGVRNSGALAVVEGVGDHGCEYMTGGVVVVLGATGRNFAAGMSGGVAYVLDAEGLFERRCNRSMVSLESVEAGSPEGADLSDMLRHDEARLTGLIESHVAATGSARGREILDDWESWRGKFVKVMPVEYRRALESAVSGSAMRAAAGA